MECKCLLLYPCIALCKHVSQCTQSCAGGNNLNSSMLCSDVRLIVTHTEHQVSVRTLSEAAVSVTAVTVCTCAGSCSIQLSTYSRKGKPGEAHLCPAGNSPTHPLCQCLLQSCCRWAFPSCIALYILHSWCRSCQVIVLHCSQNHQGM